MKVVVVESPAKAKTIGQYLGRDYRVLASFGHVRDLIAKDGAVDPDNEFAAKWEVSASSRNHIKAISDALKNASGLVLATDPDREGEAISWHLLEHLRSRRAVKKSLSVARVTFNAVTAKTVKQAMAQPREIDQDLVDAYLARRCLDYLFGFKLSPVLWRKLPGARSAGRVQSVALRLVTDREGEIETFRPREYWTISVEVEVNESGKSHRVASRLTAIDGKSLTKFAITGSDSANRIAEDLRGALGEVAEITNKPERRTPAAPFTTSTLQQEASRKLNLSARDTMSMAQRLYEGINIGGETTGLITYMRTDAVTLNPEAISACRNYIANGFGEAYLPKSPRNYKSKARITQEAHEAIRPTSVARHPDSLKTYLRGSELALYRLIWSRTVASQMADARFDRTTIRFALTGGNGNYSTSASGLVLEFDGFLKLYQEGVDDGSADANGNASNSLNQQRATAASDNNNGEQPSNHRAEADIALPQLSVGAPARAAQVQPAQHFTRPPPRYTEASLIKEMEKVGIGRPSTYTSTLTVLREREYVRLENKRMIPEARGRLVTAFLTHFFPRYVDYEFTARLEGDLDSVASGDQQWKTLMQAFWQPLQSAISDMNEHDIGAVLDAISPMLEHFLFPSPSDESEPTTPARQCPKCQTGTLSLRLGKFGAFLGCNNYPQCTYVRQLVGGGASGNGSSEAAEDISLGVNPASGSAVLLRHGRFGPYVEERGQEDKTTTPPEDNSSNTDNKGKGSRRAGKSKTPADAPKRCGLPTGLSPSEVTLDLALQLLALPRLVTHHPEQQEPITANLGRYGPYLSCGKTNVSLSQWQEVLNIQGNRAISLIEAKRSGALTTTARKTAQALRSLGVHPQTGEPVEVLAGKYGPYVKSNGINATVPRATNPEEITLDEALELLAARAERMAAGSASPRRGKGSGKAKVSGSSTRARGKSRSNRSTASSA